MPSATGTEVFLSANPDLQVMCDRVEGAGHFAMTADTEGNTVGLHSQS